jgi:hypothetical protein
MLGGSVEPAKYSQEEFILMYGSGTCLVECKGVGKSIALTHLRQLTDYLLRYEEEEKKAGKGILFGNAWNELAPGDRGKVDTPIFPDNVVRRAQQLDIALVSSDKFFAIFEKYLAGKVSADAILRRITESVGVVEFNDLG